MVVNQATYLKIPQVLMEKLLRLIFMILLIEIISLGHRNPEGLYYDKKNNYILETEHGPAGGDEINMIKFNNLPVTKK